MSRVNDTCEFPRRIALRLAHSRLSLRRSRRDPASLGRDLRIKGRPGARTIGSARQVREDQAVLSVHRDAPSAGEADGAVRARHAFALLPESARRVDAPARLVPKLRRHGASTACWWAAIGTPGADQRTAEDPLHFPRTPGGTFSCAHPTASGRFSHPTTAKCLSPLGLRAPPSQPRWRPSFSKTSSGSPASQGQPPVRASTRGGSPSRTAQPEPSLPARRMPRLMPHSPGLRSADAPR